MLCITLAVIISNIYREKLRVIIIKNGMLNTGYKNVECTFYTCNLYKRFDKTLMEIIIHPFIL